jgi:hypothetical protein
MKHRHGRLLMTALAWLLGATSAARADLLGWSYDWDRSPISVSADGQGTGTINLATNPGGHIVGDSNIVAVNLNTASSATAGAPDTFTNKPYSLTMTLTDGATQASGQVTFAGHFDGTLTATSASIKNTFDGDTTKTLQVGNDIFTVSIGSYTPPGAPNSVLTGSISAFVSVVQPVPVIGGPLPPVPLPPAAHAPEPSTLVLAVLAVPLWGLACRRRRRRTAA